MIIMLKKMIALIVLLAGVVGVHAQDASGWRLAKVEDLLPTLETYGKVNSTLALSPDGKQLAWAAPGGLCLYDLDAEEGECQPLPETFAPGFNEYNAPRWSADSAYIAFTEDTFRTIHESDVWVYKLASGEFTDLTDDGIEGAWFSSEVEPDLDYALAWSSTSNDLYFFRSRKVADGWSADLYRTYPGNYEPEQIASFTDGFPTLSVYFPPAISPDGKTMAVLVLDQKLKDLRSGLWTINLADGKARLIANLPDLVKVGFPDWQDVEKMIPREVAWAGNDTLLVQVFNPQFATAVSWGVQVVDAAAGAVTPLVDMSGVSEPTALFQTNDDGHTLINNMVRSAFVPPQADSVIYNRYDMSSPEQQSISALPLPPDGQHIALGEAPGCAVTKVPGMPRMLQQIAANGRALLYNCLLTFEG
jgi:Tol biopolymer transport system component